MFNFVKTFADVAGLVTVEEYNSAAQRLGGKKAFGYLVQEEVDEHRVWMVAEIKEGEDTHFGISCLNANGRPVINMLYLDHYVPELRDKIIHVDQSYGRVTLINARTLSRSYADIGTCHEQRDWDGVSEAPEMEVHVITPEMMDNNGITLIVEKKGIFVLPSELSQGQIRSASALLEAYKRIPVVESVIFENHAVPV